MPSRLLVIALLSLCLAAATPSGSSPVAAQDDILSHFKYGSIGTEARIGIPYPIWRVLPVVFADKLPNRPGQGYERFGFVYEAQPPQGRPIGMTYEDDRVPWSA